MAAGTHYDLRPDYKSFTVLKLGYERVGRGSWI